MSLVLGKNPSNELKEIELTNSGLLKVDVAGSSGTVAANVDVTGNSIGLATEATLGTRASESTLLSVDSNLTTVVAQESTLAGQAITVSSIDSKITQGYDAQIASGGFGAQQTLCYGRDNAGNLDALKTTSNGNLEVEISGPLGSDVSANSVSVVIASDQSAISVSSAGGNTTNVSDTLAPGAGGTATSTAVDMDGFSNLTIFGSSTNTSDNIVVQVSHNNSTWVEASEYFVNTMPAGSDVNFSIRISNEGARYWRVQQVDTLTTAFTLTVQSSKK